MSELDAHAGGVAPRVRTEQILVQPIGDTEDLLVVDERSFDAFALSGPVAQVFGVCSGERSPDAIAQELGVSVEVVAQALVELERCGLLEASLEGGWTGLMDRRGLLVRGAMLSVPLIASAALLPASAAASTVTSVSLTELASSTSGLSEPYSVAFSPDFKASTGAGLIGVASINNDAVVVFSY